MVPRGQGSIAWFSVAALLAIVCWPMSACGIHAIPPWRRGGDGGRAAIHGLAFAAGKVIGAITVILILLFSKNVYTSSLSSYYTFYLIQKFHLSVQNAQ